MFSIVPALAYLLLFWQVSRWLAGGCPQCLNRAYSVHDSILPTKTPHLFQSLLCRVFPAGKNYLSSAPVAPCPAPEGQGAAGLGEYGILRNCGPGAKAQGRVLHGALCVALLAAPAGSLPALWAWPQAGGVLLGSMLLAAALLPCPNTGRAEAKLLPGLAGRPLLLAGAGLVVAWGVLGLCSWHRGLPGYFWHLDVFVAHPLWHEVSLPGKVSLAMVLLGLCSLLPCWPRLHGQHGNSQPLPVAFVAWLLLWHAVLVTLLVPFTLGQWLAGSWWIVADFLLFWGKVGAMLFVVSPCCVRGLGPWGGVCLVVAGLGGTLVWGLV